MWRGTLEASYSDPIWEKALEVISQQVNEGTYNIWFAQTAGLGLTDSLYSVGVSSEFAKDWIDSRFRTVICDAVGQVVGGQVECEIVVVPNLDHRLPPTAVAGAADRGRSTGSRATPGGGGPAGGAPGGRGPSTGRSSSAGGGFQGTGGNAGWGDVPSGSVAAYAGTASPETSAAAAAGLVSKYTFDTFVVGQSNRFAHAAALAAAETPGTQYNPLFIYGGVGLGKTHLLQAIGHYVLRNHPGLKVRYVTLETFTNEFINSLRDDSIEGFKNRYRTVDVLLIDDVQFLQKKEQTQEEFFHTFNTLYDAQKQIVLTSDRHPKGLATLEDRLVSRFEWGLITDIQPPDLETRVAILRKKARTDRLVLSDDDTLMLIASRVPTNIRELEGCLTRVVAYSSITKRPIDVDLAREVLKDIPETAATRVTIDIILSAVSETTGISITEIIGDKRSRPVVEGRHLAMYLARELTDLSLPKIGERFGNRDHTTVLHAVDKITKLMQQDRELYNRVQRLTTKIKSA
jgi:chromosomal replication initiator protein